MNEELGKEVQCKLPATRLNQDSRVERRIVA